MNSTSAQSMGSLSFGQPLARPPPCLLGREVAVGRAKETVRVIRPKLSFLCYEERFLLLTGEGKMNVTFLNRMSHSFVIIGFLFSAFFLSGCGVIISGPPAPHDIVSPPGHKLSGANETFHWNDQGTYVSGYSSFKAYDEGNNNQVVCEVTWNPPTNNTSHNCPNIPTDGHRVRVELGYVVLGISQAEKHWFEEAGP